MSARNKRLKANEPATILCSDYVYLIQSAAESINQISQVLLSIGNKQLTLAEKAIRTELYSCAYWEGCLIAVLARWLREGNYFLEKHDGKMLRQINGKLTKQLKQFVKAAEHNLNYLEQYFEHDFWAQLTEDNPSVQLSRIISVYQDKNAHNGPTKH